MRTIMAIILSALGGVGVGVVVVSAAMVQDWLLLVLSASVLLFIVSALLIEL